MNPDAEAGTRTVDVLVVGAGFAGLYMLHSLRQRGFSVLGVDEAADVGGTWYWNRYPGARCDVTTADYRYTFDPALDDEWLWSEKYATQPEILAYLEHVAERYDLRRVIRFDTRVVAARWVDETKSWTVTTDPVGAVVCRHLVMATGCLSYPKPVDIPGVDRFQGRQYATSRWPHEPVDFTGARVGVVGTGSSAIQAVPLIAAEAKELTVFQRTAAFSLPAHNGPPPRARLEARAKDREGYLQAARRSWAGVPVDRSGLRVAGASEDERQRRFDAALGEGELFSLGAAFDDILIDPAANEVVAAMLRERIRSLVSDRKTAEALSPTGYPFGAKRACLDTGYFETFNLAHVGLVDLRREPIVTITESGIDTTRRSFALDVIVYATGFDAVTGAVLHVDIQGRGGVRLAERWAEGPSTYLGLMTTGFPNLFMLTGPGSPSVLSNMVVSIEQHVEWVTDCLEHLRSNGFETIEPTPLAEAGWGRHVEDCAALTLFPRADSWYMGANVPGKPRTLLPYVGGVDAYRRACDDVVGAGYLGFVVEGPGGTQRRDGVVRRLQPDVALVLEAMADMNVPRLELLSVADARAFMQVASAMRPPGPEVAEVVEGSFPGAAGELAYRLYRPSLDPRPVLLYFHGGGFVLGGHDSDDPFCRDLCVRSGCAVISVDYRHAPEARFPAAVEDGVAAAEWAAANASSLGGAPGLLVVGGWSSGANIAAAVSQLCAAAGTPPIAGQLLLTPLTDCSFAWASYQENAEGYGLTTPLVEWFLDHYVDPDDRGLPTVSPLRALDLSGLPPAIVVTAEFDPLRDEGNAYAAALASAGVPVVHVQARGHIHQSLTMLGLVRSGDAVREQMGRALRELCLSTAVDPAPAG